MKNISMTAALILVVLLMSIVYSCVKEGLAGNDPAPVQGKVVNAYAVAPAHSDSGCTVCTENKEVVLTPANFFGPYTGSVVEMSNKTGNGTISDADVQPYKNVVVTVMDASSRETAIPLFNMAADGSYESISYKRGSSYLSILYVRFNKSTNTFTYKPANNLTVKYSVSYVSP